jgi:peptidoglycan/LPS O-acetylase OafA/YrhL
MNIYILRIVAAQLVMFGHGIGGFFHSKLALYIPEIGVVLFILISGFAVSNSLLQKRTLDKFDFKVYIIRRISRMYPPLIASLILICIIDYFCFKYPFTYNIISFIATFLFLNDTTLGIMGFGSARPLWILPIFWWINLFSGWLILGRKTTNKKYLYFIILGFFTFLLIYLFNNNLRGSSAFFLWIAGFLLLLVTHFIYKNESLSNGKKARNLRKMENFSYPHTNKKHLSKPLVQISALISLFLQILALYIHYISTVSYDINFLVVFIFSFLFFIIYSQNSQHKYSEKAKKRIKFLANYSFTLYLTHYTLFGFFLDYFGYFIDHTILFIITYLCINLISIVIAYFTEMRKKQISAFLLRKFNLSENEKRFSTFKN